MFSPLGPKAYVVRLRLTMHIKLTPNSRHQLHKKGQRRLDSLVQNLELSKTLHFDRSNENASPDSVIVYQMIGC